MSRKLFTSLKTLFVNAMWYYGDSFIHIYMYENISISTLYVDVIKYQLFIQG